MRNLLKADLYLQEEQVFKFGHWRKVSRIFLLSCWPEEEETSPSIGQQCVKQHIYVLRSSFSCVGSLHIINKRHLLELLSLHFLGHDIVIMGRILIKPSILHWPPKMSSNPQFDSQPAIIFRWNTFVVKETWSHSRYLRSKNRDPFNFVQNKIPVNARCI